MFRWGILQSRHYILISLIAAAACYVFFQFDYPFSWRYPVRGIDISRHQGVINWKKVGELKKVDFVYVKATEGRDYVDPLFRKNREAAKKNGIKTGAYHFYSLHRPGVLQADHFLRIVPPGSNDLLPAVDLEFELKGKRPPEKKRFRQELAAFDKKIRAAYGHSPVYYLNDDFYRYYFTGQTVNNPLWIRGIFHKPGIMKENGWMFWQYSDFGRVEGIGVRVDLNVFNGNRRAFERMEDCKVGRKVP
jgi:lysozyme